MGVLCPTEVSINVSIKVTYHTQGATIIYHIKENTWHATYYYMTHATYINTALHSKKQGIHLGINPEIENRRKER